MTTTDNNAKMPDKIYAWPWTPSDMQQHWQITDAGHGTLYVRADLVAVKPAPVVADDLDKAMQVLACEIQNHEREPELRDAMTVVTRAYQKATDTGQRWQNI